jgi:chloramphenicol-sensitive protein RarD
MNRGHWEAIAAYAIWGIVPLYWVLVKQVPSSQVVCHRIVWSSLTVIPFVLLSTQRAALWSAFGQRRVVGWHLISSCLIFTNWLGFIWAVSADRIVETSLGYYINPLFSVLLGVVVLRERQRPIQWAAIGLAAIGVLWASTSAGGIPWIAMILAASFSTYGLVKKTAPLPPLASLSLETWLLALPALGFLLYEQNAGRGGFLAHGWLVTSLLVGGGLITTVPLLLFGSAAQRIPLSTLGVLQYLGPTIQLVIALASGEAFDRARVIGFGIVWVALALYAYDSLKNRGKGRPQPIAE